MVSYKNLIVFLTAIIVLFKFYNFPSWYGFDWDQERGALIIKTILVDHKPALLGLETSQGGMFIGSLFYYFVAIFYAIGGMDPMWGVGVNIFFVVLSVLSISYIGEKLFNKKVGFISTVIYSFSSYLTAFDRTLWNPTPIFFLCLWGFYLTYLYLKERKLWQLGLGTASFSFLFNSHFSVLFVVAYLFIILFLFGGRKFFLNIKSLLLVSLVFIIMLSTLIIFDSRHDLWNLRHLFLFFVGGNNSGKINILNTVLSYPAFLGNIFYEGLDRIYYLAIVGLLFVLEFTKLLLKNKNTLLVKLILLYSLMSFLPFLINKSAFLPYYLLFYFPIFIILMADLLSSVFIFPILLMIFVLVNIKPVVTSSTGLALKYKMEAVKYIVSDASGRDYKVDFVVAPGRKTGFEYIFWYYDRNHGLIEGHKPTLDPVYKLALPDSMVNKDEIAVKFGSVGIIKQP